MTHSDYELIPIKPIKDLKKEVRELRKSLSQDDSNSKLLVKSLNSNVATQKKIDSMLKNIDKIRARLDSMFDLLKNIDEIEDEESKVISSASFRIN